MSELEPGTIFGKDFRIVRPLREGGMGAVYVAEQISTGKQRALKVMAKELATDATTRERFVLEARAGSRIESDHVVEVVTAGVDETSGAPYLVMELLRGEELGDAVVRLGPLPLGDVAEVLAQIGHALEQAHALGIVHRDLKPENIFLASSKRRDVPFTAKILDFGIAKLVEDSIQKTGTQPLGTPLYMAPEQTDRKGRIRPGTDVWALGLIAFHLLTARDFWHADDSLGNLLREICVDPIHRASVRVAELQSQPIQAGQVPVPALPGGFDDWFARCVNREVDARFSDAGEAVRAFQQFVPQGAPRGALVASTGPVDASRLGATAPGATAPVSSASGVSPALARTESPISARAATVAPFVQTPGRASGGSGATVWMAIGAFAVLGVAGFAAYRYLARAPVPPSTASSTTRPTSTPTPPTTATPAPAATASGSAGPVTCPADMVLVEGGRMVMGARDLMADSKPTHAVTVHSFCLDRTEVTTKAYFECVKMGICERPPLGVSWPDITPGQKKNYSPLCNNLSEKDRQDHPINCVAWKMADDYCKYEKKGLPTEAQWEFAARGGKDQRIYPWGDEPPGPKYLNACGSECKQWFAERGERVEVMYDDDDKWPATAPVGSFPAGAAASGALDLAGNVWEWTADWYGPYEDKASVDPTGPDGGTSKVVRGEAFTAPKADWARPAYRWKTNPDTYNHAIGFRCAAPTR